MPTIPTAPQMISTDVPGAPSEVGTAGLPYRALSSASAQVADASTDVFIKLRDAESRSAVASAVQQDELDSKEFMVKARMRSKDGYAYDESGNAITDEKGHPVALTQYFKDWADMRYRETQTKLPSPFAQRMYQSQMGDTFSTHANDMFTHELSIRAKSLDTARKDRIDKHRNAQTISPNIQDFYTNYDKNIETLESERFAYSQEAYDQRKIEITKEMPEGVLSGFEHNIMSYEFKEKSGEISGTRSTRIDLAEEALSLLGAKRIPIRNKDGKIVGYDSKNMLSDPESARRARNGMPTLASSMDPERKEYWIEKFNRMIEQAKKDDKNNWTAEAKRVANSRLRNERNEDGTLRASDEHFNDLLIRGKSLYDAGDLDVFEFAENIENAAVAKTAAKMNTPEFVFASAPKKDALMANLEKQSHSFYEEMKNSLIHPGDHQKLDVSGVDNRLQREEKIKQLRDSVEREAHDDFTGLVIKTIPGASRYANAIDFKNIKSLANPSTRKLLAGQYRLTEQWSRIYRDGAPGPNPYPPLSDKQAGDLKNTLENKQVPANAKAEAIRYLYQTDPNYFVPAIHQLVTEQGLSASWYLAASVPRNSILSTQLVNAITGPQNPDQILNGANADIPAMQNKIDQGLAPYIGEIIRENPNSPIGAERAAVIRRTVLNVALIQVATEGKDAGEAVDSAIKSFAGSQMREIRYDPSNRFGFSVGGKKRMVNTEVGDVRLLPEDFSTIEKSLTKYKNIEAIKALNPAIPEGLPPGIKDKFHETILKTLDFRNHESGRSKVPTWIGPMNERFDLLQGDSKGRPLKGKNGKYIPIELPLLKLAEKEKKKEQTKEEKEKMNKRLQKGVLDGLSGF